MPVHAQVLSAAIRICKRRGRWTFSPAEVVAALPGLNAGSVRTHVMSRCCVNAPQHHTHRWPYFRRVSRGRYMILPAAREGAPAATVEPDHAATADGARRQPVFIEVREETGEYVVEDRALPEGIREPSLDGVVARIRELTGDPARATRGKPEPDTHDILLRIRREPERPDPLIACYEKEIDRTLIRENLRLTVEERLEKLHHWQQAMAQIRGVARRAGEDEEPND